MQHRIGIVQLGSGGVLICGLLMGVLAWSESAGPSDDLRRRMTGSFVLAEPESDIEVRLGQAVEHVVARMGSRVQGVARAQLSRVVAYCREYQLEVGLESVRVECERAGAEGSPVMHSRFRDTPEGGGVQADFRDDAFVLSSETTGGAETTTYRLDESGGLEVDVHMTSEQLERPLAWTVRYRRASPEVAPAPRVAVSLSER